MIEKYCDGKAPAVTPDVFHTADFWKAYAAALDDYHFDEAVRVIERYVTSVNQAIDIDAPFKKAKLGIDVSPFMYQIAEALRHIAVALLPIIPSAAEKVLTRLSIDPATVSLPEAEAWGGLKTGSAITKGEILFPRLGA
jgi:methionyl-tRNA synthetase